MVGEVWLSDDEQRLSIFGSGFLNDCRLACRFDASLIVSGSYVSETEIFCSVKKSTFGRSDLPTLVSLEVTNDQHNFSNSVSVYFRESPVISFITPSSAQVSKMDKKRIEAIGSGFMTKGTYCVFGTVREVARVTKGGTTAMCNIPYSGVAQTISFYVMVDGVHSNSKLFTYL